MSLSDQSWYTPSAPRPIVPGATEFQVELARTGVTLTVPAHRSILSVVRDAVPDYISDCENGECGTCAALVLAGVPEHRDSVLSAEDREANDVMMICVGRAKSPLLVLDI